MFLNNNGLLGMILEKNPNFQAYAPLLILFTLGTMILGYLLGSINSAILVSKFLYHDDIRKYGSGNPGTTNMLRTFGKKAAILTLTGDALKTILSICIAGVLLGFNYRGGISLGFNATGLGTYTAGLFSVLGHIFPIYYRLKGGKGVLSTAAMALVLTPVPFAILLLVFIGVVAISRYVSLGSVTIAVLYPVTINGYCAVMFGANSTPGITSLCTILIAILIVFCHRGNLRRISERTERKLSFGKKDKDDTEAS